MGRRELLPFVVRDAALFCLLENSAGPEQAQPTPRPQALTLSPPVLHPE